MAKTPTIVDLTELQKIITQLEADKTFSTLGELWRAVADTDWAKAIKPRPLSPQVAMLKAKEGSLIVNTKPGKLRRSTNQKSERIPLKLLTSGIPAKYNKLVARLNTGSYKAGVKLKCLDCSAWQPSEVRDCTVTTCPLYPIRPFRKKNAKPDPG